MKVLLMHRDRDFDLERPPPPNAGDLVRDLALDALLDAMGAGDEFLRDVAGKALLASVGDPDAIVYRQRILADALERPAVVREIYNLVVEAIEAERQVYFGYRGASPATILHGSVRVLELVVGALKGIRRVTDAHAGEFRSEGFTRLFAMFAEEIGDDYFDVVRDHLRRLRFRDGVPIAARLGPGNAGSDYTLLPPAPVRRGWLSRLPLVRERDAYTFEIPDRDEAGARALGELRARGVNLVANALAQSADHILSFLRVLRVELGFYVCCLNLHDRLAAKGEPVCLPEPAPAGAGALSAVGLYDPCLSLGLDERLVGNELAADGRALVMITGANQGGKSTFLRAMGVAQLMLQCGMFAPAEAFRASITGGVFTHYKREEDATMRSGKLDEELARMSQIADLIGPGSVLLCNESFSSTNEREGSEIARQIVRALLDRSVRVLYVTHLFELARGLHQDERGDALFLRAERRPDGRRTYRLAEGEPLPTSYGRDLYERIFGDGERYALARASTASGDGAQWASGSIGRSRR